MFKTIKLLCLVLLIVLSIFYDAKKTNANANEFNLFQNEVIEPGIIQVVDPFTKKEVKKFILDDYQLVTDLIFYRNEIANWVHYFAKGSEGGPGYNKPMILDRIDEKGNVIKGRPLITVNEDALIESIIQHSFSGGVIELPLTYTESDYSELDVPHFNEVVLASYTTHFRANKSGRSKNIELSSIAISNVIVGNGDIFSFNSVVGPREVATGYQVAPEIIKGKMVMGIGGGICQTSSTLFNAVDKLALKILERHHHSKDVGYVPKGRDATVSFGGLDFIFENTTGIPFIIKTYYFPGSITVQIKTSKEYAQILKNEF